ncbi:HlyD family secretion protein [Burkholderia plantarii]|uniref:HlyD family secretion protein n=1 Tax=Burkholderia plantarii TaxID=41899 RepID=UPI00272CEF90|nr:HlyD family secretion protein [Burkholderia plantarii]WLE61938.1 HlyD family secretion protein [Burkholderia plantarii]
MSDNQSGAPALPPTADAKPKRKRKPVLLVLIVLIVVLLGYAIYWWLHARFYESTDDAYVGGNITVISPHVAGYVSELLVEDNQRVHAGQPLLRLQPGDFAAALDAARANEAAMQAARAQLVARRALQQTLIDQASAEVAGKSAALAFARIDATRYRNLLNTEAGTRQSEERTNAALKQAQAQLDAATAKLREARQQVAVLDSEVAGADATILQAAATRRTAELNSGYTELRAPIDGYVGNRSIHVGSYVTPGTQLMSVVAASGLWVDANFKEDQLARMRAGQGAKICADVRASQCFQGHVHLLAPATGAVFSVIPPQNATGNFTRIVQRVPVRIAFDAADGVLGVLRPGLSTTVTVDTHGAAQ